MKKWWLIPILILFVILIACKAKKSGETAEEVIDSIAQQIATNIQSAQEELASGNVSEGAGLLLDAVLLTRSSERWPEGFEEKLADAKKQFQGSNLKDGVGSITEALELFKANTELLEELDKQKPKQTGEAQTEEAPARIAEFIKNNLNSALEKFKEGDADRGVILILEALTIFAPKN